MGRKSTSFFGDFLGFKNVVPNSATLIHLIQKEDKD